MLAKLFLPSITSMADSNFEVTMSFVGQVSRAAARNTTALIESAEEIATVRQEVLDEFCEVAGRVAMRFARRNQPLPIAIAQQAPQFVEPPRAVQPRMLPRVDLPDEHVGELSTPRPRGATFFEHVPRLPQ